ncbi:hypothetical protein EVAR_52446_1 [Eumeta japonica]|uniref:Uncharacterized protein n=1 Tax=Eumeta variegata TaxID=151549 RepID=A0A4C1YK06_EUMVA|nr:hypothetical protein EVAR_52446_1 [Eumeta japonica]
MSVPNLPTTQQILEDIFDSDVMKENATDGANSVTDNEESIGKAYNVFKDLKELETHSAKYDELNEILSSLNQKLIENINNIRKQS